MTRNIVTAGLLISTASTMTLAPAIASAGE